MQFVEQTKKIQTNNIHSDTLLGFSSVSVMRPLSLMRAYKRDNALVARTDEHVGEKGS
jgi:hypothetical protein